MSVYNLKDIIRMNQEIGETGQLREESSLFQSIFINIPSSLDLGVLKRL